MGKPRVESTVPFESSHNLGVVSPVTERKAVKLKIGLKPTGPLETSMPKVNSIIIALFEKSLGKRNRAICKW